MTANCPTVSVVLPTYNRAHLIERAIRSLLVQTFEDWELLVVDDGSTDDTEEVIRRFNDVRMRYVRHEVNRGAPAARNTGIKASRGEYVALLDSDDEWVPEKLRLQVDIFQRNPNNFERLGVVIGGTRKINHLTSKIEKDRIPKLRGNVYENFFSGGMWGNGTFMVRKACFDSVGGFDEQLPASHLWDMSVRLAREYEFDSIEVPLEIKHRGHGPHVRNRNNLAKARYCLLRKYRSEFARFPKVTARLHLNLGVYHLSQRNISMAREEFRQSLKLDRWRLRTCLYLLMTTFSGRLYVSLSVLKHRLFESLRRRRKHRLLLTRRRADVLERRTDGPQAILHR